MNGEFLACGCSLRPGWLPAAPHNPPWTNPSSFSGVGARDAAGPSPQPQKSCQYPAQGGASANLYVLCVHSNTCRRTAPCLSLRLPGTWGPTYSVVILP